ncbi:MAG: phosphopantetheine-binding protein [Sulfurimonas sp.]|nr:phosphopantetheine-binding protein [Sulfurimonas sp.]
MITIEKLKNTLIQGLNLEDITADEIEDNMQIFGDDGLGLDSVDAIELTLIIEKEFGVKITNLAKAEEIFASCESLTTYINDQLNN